MKEHERHTGKFGKNAIFFENSNFSEPNLYKSCSAMSIISEMRLMISPFARIIIAAAVLTMFWLMSTAVASAVENSCSTEISLSSFRQENAGNDNGKIKFKNPSGLVLPRLCGGVFRLRLNVNLESTGGKAELIFTRIRNRVVLTGEIRKTAAGETVADFPVSYELDGAAVTIDEIKIDPAAATGKTSVELLSLSLESPKLKCEVDTGAGRRFSAWKTGDPCFLILSNIQKEHFSGEIDFEFTAESGDAEWHRKELVSLNPGESVRFSIPVPKRFGLYMLRGTIPGNHEMLIPFSKCIAYMIPSGPPKEHPGMQYGIALLASSLPYVDRDAEAAAWCGADFIRTSISWMDIEKKQGQWDFSYPDGFISALESRGLRLAPMLWCPPRWATRKNWTPVYQPVRSEFGFPCPDYDLWEKYVRKVTERYGEKFRVMEVWNEPELPIFANFTPEEYAELLKRAYQTIKKVRPELKVTTCGYTCLPGQHPAMTDPDFMPKSLKKAHGFYDMHSIHIHGPFPDYAYAIDKFLELRKDWDVTVPWAANETAISATECSRQAQAEILFEKMIFSYARGAIAYNWHIIRDTGRAPKNIEHHFGLLDNAFEPKPAFLAYNTVTSLFRGAEFVKDFSTGSHPGLFLFRNGSFMLLAGWTYYPPAPERLFAISGIAGKAFLIDIYGNREELKVIGGCALFRVSSRPATLLLEQRNIPSVEEFCGLNGQQEAARLNLKLNLPKGSEHQVTINAEMENNPDFRFEPLVFSGKQEHDFSIATGTVNKSEKLKLTLSTVWGKETVNYYLAPCYRILSGAYFSRKPDFVLKNAEDRISTLPNDPTYQDCFWKGQDDCSAQVWLGFKNGCFVVRVEVRDDIHFQEDQGNQIYQGDSLQFLIPGVKQGNWKLGFALNSSSNKPVVHCWEAPFGKSADELLRQTKLQIVRDEQSRQTVYNVSIPGKMVDIEQGIPFRFNLLVNDNDGKVRVGYFAIAPGSGDSNDTNAYATVLLEKR